MTSLPGGMPAASRDLLGHGPNPPNPHWPGGARLALSFVVNVEEGAELSLLSGDDRNESLPEAAQRIEGAPDPGMESHFDYGARVGLWRILDAFDRYGLKATFSCCGRAIAATPVLAAAPHERGHEVSAHGWRWEVQAGMQENTERAVIAATVDAIRKATGERPVGWHSKSAASLNTRRLLIEEGGFLYDSDAYDDEIPRFAPGSRHVILPYCFDTNDMRFAPGGGFVQAEDFSRYCIGAIDWLLGQPGPGRMLSIGLHLRLIARPGRMAGLEAILRYVAGRPDIWVARRRDIARHWRGCRG
ncbi:chitin deacetylase [Rhodovarius crocodyli]|uniref:Chitooligosaccharide deacetylase n=1 Tax=Rhodovarius crocodyli TaxID=1979269 RepID=A0A437M3Z3_9PROT|nr:polysaccharide deacetylase family protein [Rhodovarius crocodyli]RVT92194.1 chitin deacetylase [Rhodovarius crocodyli]